MVVKGPRNLISVYSGDPQAEGQGGGSRTYL